MGVIGNDRSRRLHARRTTQYVHRAECHRWKNHALNRCRLAQNSVSLRHGLTTILTIVAVRMTAHGFAALHRLIRRGHADTIQSVCREAHREPGETNWSCKKHPHQTRSFLPSESMFWC